MSRQKTFAARRSAFERTINALTSDVLARRARGDALLDLTVSNPTAEGLALPYDRRAITAALADEAALRYAPEPFGLPAARAAAAASLTHPPSPERVLLTASTSEAYAFVFKLLCDPGDEVLVPEPSYPLFEHLARLEGVRLVPYRLAYDGAWHVDLASVRAGATRPDVRAVLVVSPNNPTGSYLKKDELAALGALGLPIVSDEVFADYPLLADDTRAETARIASDVLTFSMGGLSKSCGLPQMKLAWTAVTGPEPEVDEALARLEIIADAYLSASAPVQVALPALLAAGSVTRRGIHERVRANADLVERALRAAGSPATLLRVEGGWTACLRLPKTEREDAWVRGLLAQGVLVQPGAYYDFAEEPMIVLSLLTAPREIEAGLERLIAHVARFA